jgi:tetratricopeptide (TPR) repeat protein
LGVIYNHIGNYGHAVNCFQKAIEINPKSPSSWSSLCSSYIYLKEYDRAAEYGRKSVELNPDHHEGWFNLGFCYKETKQFDRAIESYKKVIKVSPQDHNGWFLLGVTYLFIYDVSNAENCINESWERSNQRLVEAAIYLGYFELLRSNHLKALDWFRKSRILWPQPQGFFEAMELIFSDLIAVDLNISTESYEETLKTLKREKKV